MKLAISEFGWVLIGLVLLVPTAADAETAVTSQDSIPITARVNLISKLVPSNFTVVLDPNPADATAKLQFLEYAHGLTYRLTVAPTFGDRAEIYLVTPLKYRVSKPKFGQYSPFLASKGDIDFVVKRINPWNSARPLTFWKHQVNLYLKGGGGGEEARSDMADAYPRRIQSEFPQNALAGPGADPLTLWTMHRIFAVADKKDDLAQARQQYLALLLNTVSGKIESGHRVADDGATVNDAIRYLGVLIGDDTRKNDDDAAKIATHINEARKVSNGDIQRGCLGPVSDRIDRGREIRLFKEGGEEIDGRFKALALDKDLLTMTVASDGGDQTLDIAANQIVKIQYEDEGKVKAGAVIGGFLLGAVAGFAVGVLMVDKDAGAGQFFYIPPEPFVGAGLGAIAGMITGGVLSARPDTRTIQCEDGLAKITE